MRQIPLMHQLELQESIVSIRRVTKVVKGGKKTSRFQCCRCGVDRTDVGVGLGKPQEIPEAVRKS